jgi:SAM-dependent methyltransferase
MLEMSRAKPKLWWSRAAYLLKRFILLFPCEEALAKVLLNMAWLSRRLAFEVVGTLYGNEFYNSTLGIDEQLLRSVISTSDSVLDVGCGRGRWAICCARFAREVTGIDFSQEHIAEARTHAPVNCRFVIGDVTKDLSGTFDFAILSHILEHIDTPREFLRSIPAKRLIVELPDFNADCLNGVRHKLKVPCYYDNDHVREYTAESLRMELESAGLNVEKVISRNGSLVAIT